MKESLLRRKRKKMRESSESPSSTTPPPTSFSSLPYDVAFNCLARLSRTHSAILPLVSKSFRSILASPDLEYTRSLIGKQEKCLYVCLNLNNKPSWFILSPIPKQRMIPIPCFPYEHPKSSTVVSIGTEIYMIGGFVVKGTRSRRSFVLDCKSHQWRRLPKMRVGRKEAAGIVVDGKIRVIGGCSRKYEKSENWVEIYDPKTQTLERMRPTELDLDFQTYSERYKNVCWVKVENSECLGAIVSNGKLVAYGVPYMSGYEFPGLEAISSFYLLGVANPDGGSKVTVWWKKKTEEFHPKTEIWRAQISFSIERFDWGLLEWSENVFTFQESESNSPDFLLHSALVTHDH